MKARYYWNKRTAQDLETAIFYFNLAICQRPRHAFTYAGLAEAYTLLPGYGGIPNENFPRSNAAARKALGLDATLARLHVVLGANEMDYDWDFAGAEAEFKKAFELDPNDATAHQWYADGIGAIGGREQESFSEADHARQLDPMSPMISVTVGYVHAYARQSDEAILVCKKVVNDNPKFA